MPSQSGINRCPLNSDELHYSSWGKNMLAQRRGWQEPSTTPWKKKGQSTCWVLSKPNRTRGNPSSLRIMEIRIHITQHGNGGRASNEMCVNSDTLSNIQGLFRVVLFYIWGGPGTVSRYSRFPVSAFLWKESTWGKCAVWPGSRGKPRLVTRHPHEGPRGVSTKKMCPWGDLNKTWSRVSKVF